MEKLSIIVSVYNEEAGIRRFYEVCAGVLASLSVSYEYEIIFINDGSSDKSGEILRDFADRDREHVRVIEFSKNFGHEAAMTAGLDYALGDILIFLDSDLQHPPRLIPEMVEKMEAGADIINMVRTKNSTAGLIKNITSGGFYALINLMSDIKLEPSASDFFALRKEVAEVFEQE